LHCPCLYIDSKVVLITKRWAAVVIAFDTSVDLNPHIRISNIGIGLLSVTDLLSELTRSRYPDYRGCREMSNSYARLSVGSHHIFKFISLRMED